MCGGDQKQARHDLNLYACIIFCHIYVPPFATYHFIRHGSGSGVEPAKKKETKYKMNTPPQQKKKPPTVSWEYYLFTRDSFFSYAAFASVIPILLFYIHVTYTYLGML